MSDHLIKRLGDALEKAAVLADQQHLRIEKLEADLEVATMKRVLDSDRIEKLEAALREIAASAWDCNGKTCEHCQPNSCQNAFIAREALEGKDD